MKQRLLALVMGLCLLVLAAGLWALLFPASPVGAAVYGAVYYLVNGAPQAVDATHPFPVTSTGIGSASDSAWSESGDGSLTAVEKDSNVVLRQIRDNVTPQGVNLLPVTTGGALTYSFIATASTNAANIKATPGQFYGLHCHDHAAYEVTVRLYNLAVSPTVGTSTIAERFPIAAGGSIEVNRPNGTAYGVGISISATKNIADSDTTVLVASDVTCNVDYF